MTRDPNHTDGAESDVRRMYRIEAELRHALEIVRRQGDRLQDAQRELIVLRQRTARADEDDRQRTRAAADLVRAVGLRDATAAEARARRANRRRRWLGRVSHRLDQLNTAVDLIWSGTSPAPARRRAARQLLRHPAAAGHLTTVLDSGLFDEDYYRRQHAAEIDGSIPIVTYVIEGLAKHHRPNAVFDPLWYRAKYPDVDRSGLSTLAHYVVTSERELRDPHPLFDAERYARHALSGVGSEFTPLAHYLQFGSDPALSPHALFDPAFYLRSNPDVRAAGANVLCHFLEYGSRDRRQGHPLVDPSYYHARYPDAAAAGDDALVDFCVRGAALGRSPHPLFDTAFYLEHAPEVKASGRNALEHFLEVGWREGRRPNPLFDPRYYLARYSDVRTSGVNPLIHFVEAGARQLRDPSAEFCTSDYLARYADVAQGGGDALAHYLWHGRNEGRVIQPAPAVPALRDDGFINVVTLPDSGIPVRLTTIDRDPARPLIRTVIVATHVVPVPPRAGNAYRTLRLLQWLRRAGYRTILVMSPLEELSGDASLRAIAAEIGDVILVKRDGTIEHVLQEGHELVAALEGRTVIRRPGLEASGPWRHVDEGFCHEALIEVVLHLQAALHPCALLVQYIWMSRLLPLADRRTLKIVDTIDAYSSKAEKVGDFGIGDHFLDEREEARRLERADLVLAIQDEERAQLARVVPHRRVITVGVDFDAVTGGRRAAAARRIGYVGSDNPMNVQGVKDFLRFAWSGVLARFPDAELVLGGHIANALAGSWPNVRRAGPVGDLDAFYAESRLIINPANAGTGLKIKCLEAICHFRPLVTWPAGIEGFGQLGRYALLAHDWFEFTEQVCRVLERTDAAPAFSDDDRRTIQRLTDADSVYADLGTELDAFFDLHEGQPALKGADPTVQVDLLGTIPLHIEELEHALEQAGRQSRHLLLRLADVSASPEAIQMLEIELTKDPHFGAAIPRALAPNGSLLPLINRPEGEAMLPRRVRSWLPERYISAEFLAPCMLIRSEVAANFGTLDRRYASVAGSVLDMLCRARRAGFRTVVVNHAGVQLAGDPRTLSALPHADRDRLALLYPECERVSREFGPDSLARDEAVLAAMPARGETPTLLMDGTDIAAFFNGMSHATLAIADAMHRSTLNWPVDVLVTAEAADFHGLRKRFPRWRVLTSTPARQYTVGFRLSQPWQADELVGLHRHALFNVFLMLDCIAWDVGYVKPPGLGPIWTTVANSADALIFISAGSRERFETRFACAADVRRETCLLSCDPADYRTTRAGAAHGGVLIIGNAYDHKHVNRTVELLVRTFPYAHITAVGATAAASRVDRRPSGLISEDDIQQIYASADVVIVPSFYEGFSLPVANALAYGRTVFARRSSLLQELAQEWPATGRLIDFSTPEELVDKLGLVLHGRAVTEISLGQQAPGHRPRNWSRVAADVTSVLESVVAEGSIARWQRRRDALPYSTPDDPTWP